MKTTLRQAGFSLVISLIILTLVAIMVTGFLSSTALDRATAHAFASKTQAEAAAETAVNFAISQLREHIAQYPDSATYWETLTPAGGGPAVEGTMLYYYDLPLPNGYDSTTVAALPRKRYVLPLMSHGANANGTLLGAVEVTEKAKALGSEVWRDAFTSGAAGPGSEPNCVDLNRRRSNTDSTGWIGSPPRDTTSNPPPRPYRAKWIDIKEGGTPTGKTIARYAFWMEDESFKVNLNLLGSNLRGLETTENARLKTDPAATPTPAPLPAQIAGFVPIQGLLRGANAPIAIARDTVATDATTLRASVIANKLPELRSFNQLAISYSGANGKQSYRLGDETKFLATTFSGGLNLSRHGSQRLNLNGLGFDKPLASLTDAQMNKQIQQVVETIKHHAPNFGQRFYRSSATSTNPAVLNADTTVPAANQNIYLYKVAANIRDYVDPDSQPTLIKNDGTVSRGLPANYLAMSAHDGANDYWAQGKDAAPFLQEAVVRLRSSCDNSTKRYKLYVDYYVEFWNMTDHDIYAAPQPDPNKWHLNNAVVKVADPVGWFGHGGGTPSLTADNSPVGNPEFGRDLLIDLTSGVYHPGTPRDKDTSAPEGVVFKAGACTVIMTDPDDLLPFSAGSTPGTCYTTGGLNKVNTYYCSQLSGKRSFEGPVPNPGSYPNKCDGIWPQFRDAPDKDGKNQEDYGTEVIFANSSGYLDSHPYTISKGGGPFVAYLKASDGKTSRDDTYGGTLFGNGNSPSQLGDPRTNNEQLQFARYTKGGTSEPDQTRYFNPTTSDKYRFSLGWPNSRYVFPYLSGSGSSAPYAWKDYYKVWSKTATDTPNDNVNNPDVDTAPATIANENLKSIGQLANVFDPARLPGNGIAISGISYARGGGRTFKIGQKDDRIDMNTLDAKSKQWASWRLVDFFGTANDIFLPGLVNINGIRRDEGAAFRAAFEGLMLHSVSQDSSATNPSVANVSLETGTDSSKAGLQHLIDQIINRFSAFDATAAGFDTKPGYFRERGELSEFDLFSSANYDLLPTVNMSYAFDRTREELLRRAIDLITTRGSVFSVYAVAQSVTEGTDPAKTLHVTGEHRVKVTFALVPRKADGSDFQVKTEDFDPTDSQARLQRFAKPDHYDIQYLQVAAP